MRRTLPKRYKVTARCHVKTSIGLKLTSRSRARKLPSSGPLLVWLAAASARMSGTLGSSPPLLLDKVAEEFPAFNTGVADEGSARSSATVRSPERATAARVLTYVVRNVSPKDSARCIAPAYCNRNSKKKYSQVHIYLEAYCACATSLPIKSHVEARCKRPRWAWMLKRRSDITTVELVLVATFGLLRV